MESPIFVALVLINQGHPPNSTAVLTMSSTNSSTVWRPAFKDKDEQGNQMSDRLDCEAAAQAGTTDLLLVLQDDDSFRH